MSKKRIISGAMIVAASVAQSTAPGAAAIPGDAATPPRSAAAGIDFDMVRLDDDVFRLGGTDDAFMGEVEQYAQNRNNDTLVAGPGAGRDLKPGGNDTIVGRPMDTVVTPTKRIPLPVTGKSTGN